MSIKHYQSGSKEKVEKRPKNSKKLHSVIFRSKIDYDYGCQLYNTAYPESLIKPTIYTEKIYIQVPLENEK